MSDYVQLCCDPTAADHPSRVVQPHYATTITRQETCANPCVIRRMYREPEEVQSKATIKGDPTAPARSAIRRQQTVRHRNNHVSNRHRSHGISPGVDRHALLNIIRRDHETGPAPSHDARLSSSRDSEVEAAANVARRHASDRTRIESDRAILRDPLSYERPAHRRHGRQSALRYEMQPPVPVRADAIETPDSDEDMYLRSRPTGMRSPPPDYMPTPPYAVDDVVETQTSVPPTGSATLTPRFAPAFRFEDPNELYHTEQQRRSRRPHMPGPPGPYPSRGPPLRRNRHRDMYASATEYSPRPSVDAADGLGDRRRSFSPEESTWETLLTTITPDERLPSAHSSFTSATAPTSSLSSNSASSSATLSTAPSSRSDTLNPNIHICDETTDSECSDSDDEYAVTTSGIMPPHHQDRWARNRRELNDQAEWARRRSDRDLEYRQVHAILDRMDRDEPVPDEWWAGAGLSRNLGERVDRTERERL